MTAEKKAYAIVKRPLVQSALTQALDRQGLKLVHILRPVVDALDANLMVRSQRLGSVHETPFPDHHLRMRAANFLIGLYGGTPKASEIPPPPPKGLTVIINKDGESEQGAQQTNRVVDRTKIQPTGEVTEDVMPKVKIRRAP